jgi:hypothetical protein
MSSGVESYVLSRIAAAPLRREPFAHCIIDGIFPADFYEAIIDHWPEEESWQPLPETGRVGDGNYAERMVVLLNQPGYARLDAGRRSFWQDGVASWLLGSRLRQAVIEKFFAPAAAANDTVGDALIVSDRTNYAIGPHTDAPHRVVSLLFYLPEDATFRRFGTSFYLPLDPGFRCPGGPHHPFSLFRRATTVEFVPNRLVMFPKSDRCFHGVEPVDLPGIDRRLLIYNLRRSSSATRPITLSQSP